MVYKYEEIKELIEKIDKSSLRSLQIEFKDFKIALSKNDYEDLKTTSDEQRVKIEENKHNVQQKAGEEISIDNNEVLQEKEDYKVVKAPLVGVYYSSSAPGKAPYVEVGSKVKKGDTLCIIEAMKIMNEVTSEFDGEIVEVLRSDEDIIEFAMPLFKIK